ncbi:MAG: hypothetical protein HZB83_08240 [Deltaproteobacteria bacterium]|nr:hypothetical protein [Deltaproteobacteria bacterium]
MEKQALVIRMCPIDEYEKLKHENGQLKKRVAYLEDFRVGVFQMVRDLDRGDMELEAAHEKLKETQEQLIKSSKLTALGEMAAGLAHELNQPLTVIKGLSQHLLRQDALDGAVYDKLKLISDSSSKMELIINHLRTFSRSDEPSFRAVCINRVIEDAFILLRELFIKHSIEIRLDLKDIPAVSGDPTRLEQVVINLASNAKDAMPGGGRLTIATTEIAKNGKKLVKMTVEDTGSGIPSASIGRIFDPFFTTKETGKGTGLGLSISYGIVKEHKGEITVETCPGKGTAFHIIIPALA